jgi:hypothetical protein
MLGLVADTTIARLRAVRPPAALPTSAAKALEVEVAAAVAKIEKAHQAALEAVRTGDMTLIEGGANVLPA